MTRMLAASRIIQTTLMSLTLLMGTGCSRFRGESMLPREVSGVWTTDDPRYRGRSLELSQVFVILSTGPDADPSVEWIERVDVEPLGSERMFTVYSADHELGSHNQLSFQFSAANGGEIRFKNQGQVWKRGLLQ